MKYQNIQKLSKTNFKRRTGVHKSTFAKMVDLVVSAETLRKKLSGRPQKLDYTDQVLMTLEYLREYRTYFHVANDYEISESNCYKIIKRIEDILVKSDEFKLPSKKESLTNQEIEVVLVDVTESPIERPKKSRNTTTLERRSTTP